MLRKIANFFRSLNIRGKLFLYFIAFDLLLSLTLGFVLFRVSYDKFFHNFIEQKVSVGMSLSREMDPEIFPGLIHPDMVNDPDYEYLLSKMRQALRDENYVTWLYSLIISRREDHLFYAVDATVNSSDGIWIENKFIGIKFFLDEYDQPLILWNNREYRDNFTIVSEGHKFQISFETDEFKSLLINDERVLTVMDMEPLRIRTAKGVMDLNHTSYIVKVPNTKKTEEYTFQLKFASKGAPASLPGWPFEESDKFKERIVNSIRNCKIYTSSEPEPSAYGNFLYILVPVFGNENKCVGVVVMSLSPTNIIDFRNSMLSATAGVSFLTFLAAIFISYLISGLFVAPLNKLTSAVQELSSGNLETGVSIESRDEFGYLASRFNEMVINLKKAYEDSVSLAAIRNELFIARQIQESILPKQIPDIKGLSISVTYEPMSQVGGDYYDFHVISPTKLGIIIADVAGHGVPAAIIASMLKVAFSVQSSNLENPAKTLEGINSIMLDKCGTHFITASYLVIDIKNKKATLAKAGHPSLMIYSPSKDQINEYRTRGRLMGVYDKLNSENNTIKLLKNDRILFFTDGVMEVTNDADETFGEENFKKFVFTHGHLAPRAFREALMGELIRWKGNPTKELPDDISLVVVDFV